MGITHSYYIMALVLHSLLPFISVFPMAGGYSVIKVRFNTRY